MAKQPEVRAQCKVCKGSGKQKLTVLDPYGAYPNRPRRQVKDIDCVWCHGTGMMQAEELKAYTWNQTAWCECGNPSGESRFFDDGECECGCHKHHYHCRDCAKITQIG